MIHNQDNDVSIFSMRYKRERSLYTEQRKSSTLHIDQDLLRDRKPILPNLSELEVVRHFTRLSQKNFSVDTEFYPLGSCTMKYNPRFLETIASDTNFTSIHPMLAYCDDSLDSVQGSLELIYELEHALCEICGMEAFTTQPMAGAHGELTGILLIAAYHSAKGEKRSNIIVPDSSHGTNPASAAVAGYEVITVPSLDNGEVDVAAIQQVISNDTAAIMLTCPNTHGVFETEIQDIASLAHEYDALLYYDGANLNAIVGKIRPGDLGFDVVHVNVHKTFATPHGGGGPGAGPVGVSKKLKGFLPNPTIILHEEKFQLKLNVNSIGYVSPFLGNFSILLRSLAYIKKLGKDGLVEVSEKAVLSSNYIAKRLKTYFKLQFDRHCMHEVVFSLKPNQVKTGVRAIDIAKFLIDNGVYAPTVYFPLTVKEAMMIEPTETETKEDLDRFIELMIEAASFIKNNPTKLLEFPLTLPIERPDEVKAARQIDVSWKRG